MTPERSQDDSLFNGSMAVLVVLFAVALMLTYKWYDAGRTLVARPPVSPPVLVLAPPEVSGAPAVSTRPATPPPARTVVPGEPTFDTVRIEKSGESVIAGRSAPGASISVKNNGTVVATTMSGSDGSFVAIPDKPLPPGTGHLTLEARRGNDITSSTQSIVIAVPGAEAPTAPMVALVKPDKAPELLQAPAASVPGAVSLDSVDYDEKAAMLFSGHAPADSHVRLYANNTPVGEVRATAKGLWTYRDEARIAAGTFTLRLDAVDASGKVLSRIEMPVTRTPASNVPPGPDGRITIQPGNNLWTLSRVIYGRGTHFTIIYDANKSAIRDPDKIWPGQVLAVPGANPPPEIPPHIRKPLNPSVSSSSSLPPYVTSPTQTP